MYKITKKNHPNLHMLRMHYKPATKKEVRNIILVANNNRCIYCNTYLPTIHQMEADHFYPYSHGGRSHILNLVASCIKCNRAKSYNHWNKKYDYLKRNPLKKLALVLAYIPHMRVKDFI